MRNGSVFFNLVLTMAMSYRWEKKLLNCKTYSIKSSSFCLKIMARISYKKYSGLLSILNIFNIQKILNNPRVNIQNKFRISSQGGA